jgi:hypothetical protein
MMFISRNHSTAALAHKKKSRTQTDTCQLANIIYHELNQPSLPTQQHSSIVFDDVAIQCSSDDFHQLTDHSFPILIGRLSPSICSTSAVIRPLPGYNECGIQVDMNDAHVESLNTLIQLYSDRLSVKTIEHFYDVCQTNIQWTRTQLDEYLQHRNDIVQVPTLRQLSLNALDQWNEQIKSMNPSFDATSLADLLQDINDNDISDNLPTNERPSIDINHIELVDGNQIHIPWSIVYFLEDFYGELPNKSFYSTNDSGIVLPIDDHLSISIYQALQRCLMKSNGNEHRSTKSVASTQVTSTKTRKNKNQTLDNNQRWKVPMETQFIDDSQSTNVPSLRQIIHEEQQQAAKCQKSKQVRIVNDTWCLFKLEQCSMTKK